MVREGVGWVVREGVGWVVRIRGIRPGIGIQVSRLFTMYFRSKGPF